MATKVFVGVNPRRRFYVWEFPVRFTHWINALCVVVLSVTGFYIGRPFMHAYASDQFIMGWIRLIHFIAGYVFLMSIMIRVYWSFAGNKYSSYKEWFPFTSKQRKELVESVKFYLFLRKRPPYTLGHTALGDFTYFFVFLIFAFEVVSGFALYSVNHSGVLWTALGGWLTGIMYLQTIRLFHHFFMYAILSFFLLHIYITWYNDPQERNGLVSSVFSGYKFIAEKDLTKYEGIEKFGK